MLNMTKDLLDKLVQAYPSKHLGLVASTNFKYPFNQYGFELGHMPDNTRVCIILDMPPIQDNSVFRRRFTVTEYNCIGTKILVLTPVFKGGSNILLHGSYPSDAVSTSFGFVQKPRIERSIQLVSCNIHNDSLAVASNKPKGVFLQARAAMPRQVQIATETNLYNNTHSYENIRVLVRDDNYRPYRGPYYDIRYFMVPRCALTLR